MIALRIHLGLVVRLGLRQAHFIAADLLCATTLRGLLLFASLVHVAHASVLHDLASALLPERHVVYQHLVSTTGRTHARRRLSLHLQAHSRGV